jgi:hypothetical protein
MLPSDQIFLAQQRNSEHFRVVKVLIADAKAQMLNAIAGAKDSNQLLVAQGVIRGLNALENTLNAGASIGESLIKEAEKKNAGLL